MQSVELEPVPFQVKLSVHWLRLATESIVKLLCGRLIATPEAMLKHVVKRTRRQETKVENE